MQTFDSLWVLFVGHGDFVAGVYYHPNKLACDAKKEELVALKQGYSFDTVEYVRKPAPMQVQVNLTLPPVAEPVELQPELAKQIAEDNGSRAVDAFIAENQELMADLAKAEADDRAKQPAIEEQADAPPADD